ATGHRCRRSHDSRWRSSIEFSEKSSRLGEVGRVESLREPLANRADRMPGRVPLAPLAKETSEARRRAQLQCPRPGASRRFDPALAARLDLAIATPLAQQLARQSGGFPIVRIVA